MSDAQEYDHETNPYGFYRPSLVMAIVFLIIFGFSTIAHVVQAFQRKSPRWMVVMAVGAACEVGGWVGRLISRYDLPGPGWLVQQCAFPVHSCVENETLTDASCFDRPSRPWSDILEWSPLRSPRQPHPRRRSFQILPQRQMVQDHLHYGRRLCHLPAGNWWGYRWLGRD